MHFIQAVRYKEEDSELLQLINSLSESINSSSDDSYAKNNYFCSIWASNSILKNNFKKFSSVFKSIENSSKLISWANKVNKKIKNNMILIHK